MAIGPCGIGYKGFGMETFPSNRKVGEVLFGKGDANFWVYGQL